MTDKKKLKKILEAIFATKEDWEESQKNCSCIKTKNNNKTCDYCLTFFCSLDSLFDFVE